MPFLTLNVGIGVIYSCIWVKFSPERTIMNKLCGELTEDLI